MNYSRRREEKQKKIKSAPVQDKKAAAAKI